MLLLSLCGGVVVIAQSFAFPTQLHCVEVVLHCVVVGVVTKI